MPIKFVVIRRKTYHAEVETSTRHARAMAEKLPGSSWKLVDDRVVGFVGLDGVIRDVDLDGEEISHDPSCLACAQAALRRASVA